jgi:hypothetical protein
MAYQRLPERIRAHASICVMALILQPEVVKVDVAKRW